MAKDHGPSVKDDKQYEGLRKKGMSKERAARIANDPDFAGLHSGGLHSGDEQAFAEFGEFLAVQKQRDYPSVPRPGGNISLPASRGRPGRSGAPSRGPGRAARAG